MTDVASRLAAALADRYRIERELGAGGMATVYLAHDLKHDRKVAIKVLSPELGAVLGAERFLSEIRVTANLQHPNLLPLFDSGEAAGLLFYVMPYVEGETLRARLVREKQLPVGEAVRIAVAIANALEYAHQRGVIHRDLKPENVLLQAGQPVIADFGIALAVSNAGGARVTQTGLSLGTPQYMSPEQATGDRQIDARSDIYALGAVTFEMLAGDPPHVASTAQAIVAKVLTEPAPSVLAARPSAGEGVAFAIARALEKLPADRWTSAREFAAALESDAPVPARATAARPAPRGPWRALALVLGAVAAVLAGLLVLRRGGGDAVGPPISFDQALPDSAALTSSSATVTTGFGSLPGGLSIAPDGGFVVYAAARNGSSILWWRSLRDASAHSIPGTEGGITPRISPDAARLAFVQGNRTVVIPIGGGEARILLESDPPQSLEWVSPTRLMVINRDGFNLAWLDVETGLLENVGIVGVGSFQRRCVFGRWLAATSELLCWFNEGASIYDPKTSASTSLRTRNADGTPGASLSGTGFDLVDGRYLVFVTQEGELRAAPFDHATRTVGRAVEILRGIRLDNIGATVLARSRNGVLAYATGSEERLVEMIRRGADGSVTALVADTAKFLRFDLSRDRRQLAAVVTSGDGQELRIYDLRTGRRATWLRAGSIRHPLWDPDGRRILTRVQNGPVSALVYGAPDAAAPPDTLLRAEEPALAPDPVHFQGERLAIFRAYDRTVALTADLTRRPFTLDTLLSDAGFTVLSPDGRRIAWHTSSRGELFVSGFPLGGPRVQLATGCVEPVWLSNTELVCRAGVQWQVARFDARTGALLGALAPWGRDERFADTPGWSNRPSWDGGLVYARRPPRPDPTFIRVMPRFVDSMKAAVDAANR